MARVVVREQCLRSARLPESFDGLRIAHLSDLHLRRWTPRLAEARDVLQRLQPDLLACTGDIGDAHCAAERSGELMHRMLSGVAPRLGSYAVLGNHDDPQMQQLLSPQLRILDNEHLELGAGEQRMALAGVRGRSEASWDIPAALAGIKDQRFTLMLSHYPQVVGYLPDGRVDLLLAGHTHAGQIRLPMIGPLCPYPRGLPRRYFWGLHVNRSTTFYVNAGLGSSWIFPVRMFCPAEIAVITLLRGPSGAILSGLPRPAPH